MRNHRLLSRRLIYRQHTGRHHLHPFTTLYFSTFQSDTNNINTQSNYHQTTLLHNAFSAASRILLTPAFHPKISPFSLPGISKGFHQLPFSRSFLTTAKKIEKIEVPIDHDDSNVAQTALTSLLDSYHNLTHFPWWLIILTSTVAMRLTLAPVTILQLKKLKRIGDIMPKLPPPFPPPLSQTSFRDQISIFFKEKKAAECPSFFWFFTSLAVQAPCFLLWIMTIRTMSLGHHSGFDCGGTLWFQNLTDCPNGVWGPIFPLVIAGLHFTNVQLSFKSSLQQLPGTLGSLAKLYRMYLQVLTLPIMFTAFNLPQGSLVYWLTNSSMSLIQTICLSNPDILEYLGLPKRSTPLVASSNEERGNPITRDTGIQTKEGHIAAHTLSPGELVNYSIKLLSSGRGDNAMYLLRIALEKDPEQVRALFLMGQTLIQKEQFAEACNCLESAISKLILVGNPSEEQVDLLILSSQWAGIANLKQGKKEEGLLHLERVALLDEPENLKTKAHYYDGLFLLSSALLNVDRKDEARKYLQKLAAYDPAYKVYFKQLENDLEDFASDLANTRRDF